MKKDGAEGFLDALEDVFWVYDDATSHGIREGSKANTSDEAKVKEREKEKEKAEEDEDSSDQERKRPRKRKKESSAHMVSEEGYEEIGRR